MHRLAKLIGWDNLSFDMDADGERPLDLFFYQQLPSPLLPVLNLKKEF